MIIRRGDIYYADLRPVVGSEQGGIRPVLVIQNDTGNRHSPTVIIAAITSQMHKSKLPTHVEIDSQKYDIMTGEITKLLSQELDIKASNVYINYSEFDNWGWNGSNF